MSQIDQPVKAALIINAFMRGRWQEDFVLPNYTPGKWWECDVFQLRKSGRWIEHEVKLTLSDFKADAKKGKMPLRLWRPVGEEQPTERLKHQLLAGSEEGPNHFYFITPWGMVQPADVPDWAGLIQFQVGAIREDRPSIRSVSFETLKTAPLRHQGKISEGVRAHALGVCYWRYHHARHQ